MVKNFISTIATALIIFLSANTVYALGIDLYVANQWDDVIKIKEGTLHRLNDIIPPGHSVRHGMYIITSFQAYYPGKNGEWEPLNGCHISSSTDTQHVIITYGTESQTIPKCIISK